MFESNHGLGLALASLIKREVTIAFRRPQDVANPLIFFVLVLILFPLGVSPSPEFLRPAAAGVVWVAALLATMLSLDRLFKNDFDDGSLEQLVLSPEPLYLLVLVKLLVAWALVGLPLILLSPVLATMMSLPPESIPVLMLSLLLGTPTLMLIGGIGATLTVSLRSGGVLISLIVLPLMIPVLIFGTGTVQAATEGLPIAANLALLGALLALALTLAPFACSAALRMSVANA